MSFTDYIKPELLILIPVLYFLGEIIKTTEKIENRYIPALLGAVGIALSLLYVLGTEPFSATGIFTAITQGILVAGAAVYTNELVDQLMKRPEGGKNEQ